MPGIDAIFTLADGLGTVVRRSVEAPSARNMSDHGMPALSRRGSFAFGDLPFHEIRQEWPEPSLLIASQIL